MTIRKIGTCALITGDAPILTDAQSALELLMAARYQAETKTIVLSKELVAEDFFILRTGAAGAILQKIINYGGKIAIYGDFSHYTSKPLRDFIYESNQGRDVFFAATLEEALAHFNR